MIIAVAICKILYFIGKIVGRGSSLPGQIALKICPGALGRLKLPETIIAVTGSNGKTSTVELIARALEANGKSVGWNHEGANQIEGVATLLLRMATPGGAVKRDALVLECDERYTRFIFEAVKPSILVVTNLCRDQLTRNGHQEYIFDCIREAVDKIGDVSLVLNADDPYVAALEAASAGGSVLWFGVSRDLSVAAFRGMYDDGAFCPVCKSRMEYEYRIAGHYGAYNCGACGHSRKKPDIEMSSTRGISAAYNMAAAIAAASAAGISAGDAAEALEGYELKGGRTVRFSAGGRSGVLLISKHENSLSYNLSMSWVVRQRKPCTVIVLVDSISRKYYTSETSWLWDVDFDILADDTVQSIVLAGRYSNELMTRFEMSSVDPGKCCVAGLDALREKVGQCGAGDIYVLTCFADKAKLLKVFE